MHHPNAHCLHVRLLPHLDRARQLIHALEVGPEQEDAQDGRNATSAFALADLTHAQLIQLVKQVGDSQSPTDMSGTSDVRLMSALVACAMLIDELLASVRKRLLSGAP